MTDPGSSAGPYGRGKYLRSGENVEVVVHHAGFVMNNNSQSSRTGFRQNCEGGAGR